MNSSRSFNLLMISAGKRVSLAKRFYSSARQLGLKLNIYSYEIDKFQPISSVSQIISGKKWNDKNILSDVSKVVKHKKINLVIANTDEATILLSLLKKRFECASFVSNPEVNNKCFSKIKFQAFCEKKKINIAPRWDKKEFPCFAKPEFGHSSKNARLLENRKSLDRYKKKVSSFILQKFIEGDEYSVDAYVSRNGCIIGISPRKRLATLGGESVVSKTFRCKEIEEECSRIIKEFKLIGPLTFQFIRERSSKKIFLIEINPRFGGGVIASIESGYDYPKTMIKESLGLPIEILKWKKDILMKRYFDEVFYETSN